MSLSKYPSNRYVKFILFRYDILTNSFTQFDMAFPLACDIKYVDFTGKFSMKKSKTKSSE